MTGATAAAILYRSTPMETILILAALTACAVAGVIVAVMGARSRRAPLRLSNDLDEADEALLLGNVAPKATPIDRSAETLDLEPVRHEPPETRGEPR